MVVATGTVNTQAEPRVLLAAAHTKAIGDGRRCPFVVQSNLKTSGDVLDNVRKIWKRLQVSRLHVHATFLWTTVETKSVRAVDGVATAVNSTEEENLLQDTINETSNTFSISGMVA